MQITSADDELSLPKSIVTERTAGLRLMTGLLQGAVLYFLYSAGKSGTWPATNGFIFASLIMIFLFAPVLLISGLGHLSARRMAVWIAAASLICAILGFYDIWRAGAAAGNWFGLARSLPRMTPSGLVVMFTAIGFYIAHSLVLAGAMDKKLIARYPSYFEISWKLAIQIMFSVLFVLVLWAILWLGAALFMLVKLRFLYGLLKESWFCIPVTAFAFSIALHLTDVRPGIVRGIRSLLLVLMSWLLPITTVIVGGFLISLPFAGLAPLWATRHATSVLLGTTSILVLLINATFQGGELGKQVARVLRLAARVACVLLLPITLIAIYSLALRVQQYGWTTDRIIGAACLFVATCYAGGYLWAALERNAWLTRIAPVNVATAFVILAVLLGLFTPLADPARLSVANQLARLESGKVSAAKFDFDYLRFEGAHYGNAALQKFKTGATGADAETIRTRAEAALQKKNRWARKDAPVADAATRTANITVWPHSKSLPAGFASQTWSAADRSYSLPQCLKLTDRKCNAYLIDLNGDGKAEILLKDSDSHSQPVIFALDADGKWKPRGAMGYSVAKCEEVWQALAEDRYQLVTPEFKDLEVAGHRLHPQPWPSKQEKCSK